MPLFYLDLIAWWWRVERYSVDQARPETLLQPQNNQRYSVQLPGQQASTCSLVIHGDADRIVPTAASGQRTASLIKGARLMAIKDGPHAVNWTHADEVNRELVNFIGKRVAVRNETVG